MSTIQHKTLLIQTPVKNTKNMKVPNTQKAILTHLPHLCPLLWGDPGRGASVDVQHHLAEHQVQCLSMQHLTRGKQLQWEDDVLNKWRKIQGIWGKGDGKK